MSTTYAEPKISRSAAPLKSERMVSLDVFRGITIAGMILVNNPGSWSYVYGPLAHAEWHGWTPTDLIFPFFLFIVGVAITLSLEGRIARGESQRKIFLRILRRSIILFALGLFLNGFPFFKLSTIRIPGVLQRIALCYFFAALIFMKTKIRGQAATAIALLAVYWLLMKLVSVPGYGAGVLDKDGNLAAYLDNLLMHGHLWRPTWDPEGILSTIPAIATTMFGILTGHWLKSNRTIVEKAYGMLFAGIVGIVLGQIMNVWFPINKNLWTSSYVVFTAGMALLFLGACYWLVDGKGFKRPLTPFVIFGVNPITVFVLSGVVARLMGLYQVAQPDGTPVTLKTYIYQNLFASWAGPLNGSLFFALAYVFAWLAPMTILYRKKIFIKI
jgi:predicted acyltransferase